MVMIRLKNLILERQTDRKYVINANYIVSLLERHDKYLDLSSVNINKNSGRLHFRVGNWVNTSKEYENYKSVVGDHVLFDEDSFNGLLRTISFNLNYNITEKPSKGFVAGSYSTFSIIHNFFVVDTHVLDSEKAEDYMSPDSDIKKIVEWSLSGKGTLIHEVTHLLVEYISNFRNKNVYNVKGYDNDPEEIQARLIAVFNSLENEEFLLSDDDKRSFKKYLNVVMELSKDDLHWDDLTDVNKKNILKRLYQHFKSL